MKVALAIMVKNEEKRIHVTIESCIKHVDRMIVFDTGSTDNTIEIFKKYSEQYNVPLSLKIGEFVDFATSRNELLKYADTFTDIDSVILLDSNDEIENPEKIKNHTKEVTYRVIRKINSTKFYAPLFIPLRKGWYYKGVVHEYLTNDSAELQEKTDLVVYQDRSKDLESSQKRFPRDKELLLKEYSKKDPRTVFYLAQTCHCLGEKEEAIKYYTERLSLDGFYEEKFESMMKLGELETSWGVKFQWYMNAWKCINRAEPLIKIAEYYWGERDWLRAFLFAQMACELEYPVDCLLFVDSYCYDYHRWHVLGVVAYYCGKYEVGRRATEMAMKRGNERDYKNLKFYLDKM